MIIILVLGFAIWCLARLLALQQEAKHCTSPRTVHESTYTKTSQHGSDYWIHPDSAGLPSRAESSPRPADIGTPIWWPRILPPTEVLTDIPRSYCSSSDDASTWVTYSARSSIDSLDWDTIESLDWDTVDSMDWDTTDSLDWTTADSDVSVEMDAGPSSRGASEIIPTILSHRGSWPLQSYLPRRCTTTRLSRSQEEAKVSIRWPFLGHVRNGLADESALLDLDSAMKPFWEDWPDVEGLQSAADADSEASPIHRYRAYPGPRAPMPISLYDGRELTAHLVRLRPTAARMVVVSSPTRTEINPANISALESVIRQGEVELPDAQKRPLER
jgi:hypothetical protein